MTCEYIAGTGTGRLRHSPGERLTRHRHDKPFAAVILSGSYLEAGDRGRMRVAAGDVLLHGAYEAHLDDVGGSGAQVVVLPWAGTVTQPLGRIEDPDAIARLAEHDAAAAMRRVADDLECRPVAARDWPDLLAADLRRDPSIVLDQWAAQAGLRAETVSRGFQCAYGVTPAKFRERYRTLSAFARMTPCVPLAELAAECGFADQAHFTRSFRFLTGLSPNAWRALGPSSLLSMSNGAGCAPGAR